MKDTTRELSTTEIQTLVNRKVACIAHYAAEINTRTELWATFWLNGHVGSFDIKVCKEKKLDAEVIYKDSIRYTELNKTFNELEKGLSIVQSLGKIEESISILEKFIPAETYKAEA